MLSGEKVRLRAIERSDLPRIWEFHNDLELEYLRRSEPPTPQSLARLQAQFDAEAARGGRDGTWFGIEADGALIGEIGLLEFQLAARTASLGIAIGDREYWCRGYGRDAIRTLLRYAFLHQNLRRVWLSVAGDNERAIRAYRACGFIEEGRLREHEWCNGKYVDLVFMAVFRADWEA